MAVVDYWAIEEACAATLRADDDMFGVTVQVEEEFLLSAEMAPVVLVYLDDRTAVEADQRLSAGTRTDFDLNFSLWCGEADFGGLPLAIEKRSALIGKVEVALMRDRTLSGAVAKLRLTGGQMAPGFREETGFLAWGEVRFTASVFART